MLTDIVRIPIVFGRNKARGKSEGALVLHEYKGDDKMTLLREFLTSEAINSGMSASHDWLMKSIRQLLTMYEEQYARWDKEKNGTIGFMLQLQFPSGSELRMSEPNILNARWEGL